MTNEEFKRDLLVRTLTKITKQLGLTISQLEVLKWELTKDQYGEFLRLLALGSAENEKLTLFDLSKKLNSFVAENQHLPLVEIEPFTYEGSLLQLRTIEFLTALKNDGIAVEKITQLLSE